MPQRSVAVSRLKHGRITVSEAVSTHTQYMSLKHAFEHLAVLPIYFGCWTPDIVVWLVGVVKGLAV